MFAAREKTAVERKVLVAGTDGENHSVTKPEVGPGTAVERQMKRSGDFKALIIGIATEVFRSEFEVAEYLVAAPGVDRVIAAIMAQFGNDSAHGCIGEAGDLNPGLGICSLKHLVLVANAQISGGGFEVFPAAHAAPVLLAHERDLLTAEPGPCEKKVNIVSEKIGDVVGVVGAGRFERLDEPQA